jgi:hypothetical protein
VPNAPLTDSHNGGVKQRKPQPEAASDETLRQNTSYRADDSIAAEDRTSIVQRIGRVTTFEFLEFTRIAENCTFRVI